MSLVTGLAHVASRGSGRGLHVLNGDREAERITYEELYTDAGRVASGLLARGVMPGDRVAIAAPTSLDFARAFFGTLAAGAAAVPVPPPFRLAPIKVRMRRIVQILRQSRVRVVLVADVLGEMLAEELGGAENDFVVLDVSAVLDPSPTYLEVGTEDLALVQYTSGTISDPKGVLVSHGNLMANLSAITEGLEATGDDVCCSWLPLFHDMGLIGTFLCAALHDIETYLLPPEHFLRDPGRWLRMIDRYRGTIAAAPSSGYLHTLRKVPAEKVRELDLSSWRLALNGAENVDAEVMRRFAEHFAPAGFKRTAFLPVYGLAEATLAVAFPPLGREPTTTWVRRDLLGEGKVGLAGPGGDGRERELVSVGTAVAGTRIRLVDDEETPVEAEATIGEIQVHGEAVLRGYEANPEATRQTVRDGWVSTGDLGFWHEGELYIAGRKKEMIIIHGQNFYASDIESVAGQVPGVAVHGALAVGVPVDDGEALVMFVETVVVDAADRADLVTQVRYAVSSTFGISPREVFLVPKGHLPRTSSGKLQRHRSVARDLAARAT